MRTCAKASAGWSPSISRKRNVVRSSHQRRHSRKVRPLSWRRVATTGRNAVVAFAVFIASEASSGIHSLVVPSMSASAARPPLPLLPPSHSASGERLAPCSHIYYSYDYSYYSHSVGVTCASSLPPSMLMSTWESPCDARAFLGFVSEHIHVLSEDAQEVPLAFRGRQSGYDLLLRAAMHEAALPSTTEASCFSRERGSASRIFPSRNN